MKLNLRYDILAFIIIIIPFVYLAFVWADLPAEVPIHWNAEGEIDDYGSKLTLLLIPILLPLLTYIIFMIAPVIDPKKRLDGGNKKYQSFKVYLTSLMSALAIFILHSSYTSADFDTSVITILLGLLYLIIGNYFKTIKPNYFIGIRTPWTLESEMVWRKTHKMASVLWFIGGLLIILFSLILTSEINFIVFIAITIIISLLPILQSYLLYKGVQNESI